MRSESSKKAFAKPFLITIFEFLVTETAFHPPGQNACFGIVGASPCTKAPPKLKIVKRILSALFLWKDAINGMVLIKDPIPLVQPQEAVQESCFFKKVVGDIPADGRDGSARAG